MLHKELHRVGHHTAYLDGDNLRLGLNNDLDFSDASRHESVRRVAEVARPDGGYRVDRDRLVHLPVPRRP
ncbi:adenylyl-sulfate kinase [Paraburkholderia youngii]|uniref:adenylyl-sulfate kinase n=1 Tax=Paraburkholderia youngii TaxID=2782701 RepID=UPI003D1DE332